MYECPKEMLMFCSCSTKKNPNTESGVILSVVKTTKTTHCKQHCKVVGFRMSLLSIKQIPGPVSIHWPGEFEMCQLDIHDVDDCWQRATIHRQQREAVSHCDQTQVHNKCIVGRGGLWDDDEGSLQLDVHGQTETLPGKVSHAGCCLLRCLSRRSAQSFFSRLEVVSEVLNETDTKMKTVTDYYTYIEPTLKSAFKISLLSRKWKQLTIIRRFLYYRYHFNKNVKQIRKKKRNIQTCKEITVLHNVSLVLKKPDADNKTASAQT